MEASDETSEQEQYKLHLTLSPTNMNTYPPRIFKFDEEIREEGQVTDSETEENPLVTQEEAHVPSFMMRSELVKQIEVLEEILAHHRCDECQRFLCCGTTVFHDVNCWTDYLKQYISWELIRDIYQHRLNVLQGGLKDWEEYTFQPFDKNRHIYIPFKAHRLGLYVRCFTCEHCYGKSDRQCHCSFHRH